MNTFRFLLALGIAVALPVLAQDESGELAKIKERELEEVRDRISDLKKSMDRSAAERDRLTADLQDAAADTLSNWARLDPPEGRS